MRIRLSVTAMPSPMESPSISAIGATMACSPADRIALGLAGRAQACRCWPGRAPWPAAAGDGVTGAPAPIAPGGSGRPRSRDPRRARSASDRLLRACPTGGCGAECPPHERAMGAAAEDRELAARLRARTWKRGLALEEIIERHALTQSQRLTLLARSGLARQRGRDAAAWRAARCRSAWAARPRSRSRCSPPPPGCRAAASATWSRPSSPAPGSCRRSSATGCRGRMAA